MPKVYFWSGHGQIDGIIAGDLQENSRVRAAFISLPGGMQEARAKSKTSGGVFFVAHGMAKLLQFSFVLRSHLNEAEESEVVASADAIEMSAKIAGQSSCRFRRP